MPYITDESHKLEVGENYYSAGRLSRFCVLAELGDEVGRLFGLHKEYKLLWMDGTIENVDSIQVVPFTRVEALHRASGVLEALYRAREVLR